MRCQSEDKVHLSLDTETAVVAKKMLILPFTLEEIMCCALFSFRWLQKGRLCYNVTLLFGYSRAIFGVLLTSGRETR